MKSHMDRGQRNNAGIEQHLQSAMESLTPDIFASLDLSVPQEPADPFRGADAVRVAVLQRRLRRTVVAAAACLGLLLTGGGAWQYHYFNRQIDSVIGIDVNPSVELTINRRQRVLAAEALDQGGEAVMEDMDLTGVELNVAVNAVVGAMVTHGYLDDLDNAILVTVSNDSVKKARELRTSIVGDIERTLEENQVQAVVYDQQVVEDEEMKGLAEEYDISYGKAYFLKELIDQNPDLSMDDMEELSTMTMEEIAEKIASDSLALGELAEQVKETQPETAQAPETEPETTEAPETSQDETGPETLPQTTEASTAASEPETARPAETEPETETPEEVEDGLVEIDYVDYEDGRVYVYFMTRVTWKNPTVLVKDGDGSRYAAYVEDTSRDECVIAVDGLRGGASYSFVLGGLTPKGGDTATTVTGYFDTPEIAGELLDDDESEAETTAPENPGSEDSGAENPGPEKPVPEDPAPETTASGSTSPGSAAPEQGTPGSQESSAPENEAGAGTETGGETETSSGSQKQDPGERPETGGGEGLEGSREPETGEGAGTSGQETSGAPARESETPSSRNDEPLEGGA